MLWRRQRCNACGAKVRHTSFHFACARCNAKYPTALLKATCDEFEYALRLRTGELVRFAHARIDGDFARLTATYSPYREGFEASAFGGYQCPRGVDVRISDIVWCADAPGGS